MAPHWFVVDWPSDLEHLNINEKELLTLAVAVASFGPPSGLD
jgi:hypothetical protein